jgi:hypothetical protein
MKRMMWMLLVALMFAACSGEREKKKVQVSSKGLPSELLLVVDKAVWDSDLQDSINSIVKAQVPGLMQVEELFRVTRIFSRDYEATHTTFHTQLFVKVDKTLDKPLMGTRRNEYAKPQVELVVAAPSIDVLRDYLMLNSDRIKEILLEAQIEKRVELLRKKYSKKVDDDLKEVLGMTVRAPENMKATKKGERFLWGGTNLLEKDLNLVVYTYDWHGEDLNDVDLYVEKRDSVMKHNIPGSSEGQWMRTVRERENKRPLVECRERKIDGREVLEVRGLWEMRNGALGGPFVSMSRVDTASRRVVVGEGFVYSPSTDKRDLVRQMEAVLRTLK